MVLPVTETKAEKLSSVKALLDVEILPGPVPHSFQEDMVFLEKSKAWCYANFDTRCSARAPRLVDRNMFSAVLANKQMVSPISPVRLYDSLLTPSVEYLYGFYKNKDRQEDGEILLGWPILTTLSDKGGKLTVKYDLPSRGEWYPLIVDVTLSRSQVSDEIAGLLFSDSPLPRMKLIRAMNRVYQRCDVKSPLFDGCLSAAGILNALTSQVVVGERNISKEVETALVKRVHEVKDLVDVPRVVAAKFKKTMHLDNHNKKPEPEPKPNVHWLVNAEKSLYIMTNNEVGGSPLYYHPPQKPFPRVDEQGRPVPVQSVIGR